MEDNKTVSVMHPEVRDFLMTNGFVPRSLNEYDNYKCVVKYVDETYEVTFEVDGENATIYGKDLNIYWLVGLLTWYDLIPRNYISEE